MTASAAVAIAATAADRIRYADMTPLIQVESG